MLSIEHIKMIAMIVISYTWLMLEMKKRYADQNKPYLPYLFSIVFLTLFATLVGNVFGSPFVQANLWIAVRTGILNICFVHLITLIVFGIYKDLYKKNLPTLLYALSVGLSTLVALISLLIVILNNHQITAIGAQAGLVSLISLFALTILTCAISIIMRINKRA